MPIEVSSGSGGLHAVIFSTNGEHLLSSGQFQDVAVWRARDGRPVATMEAQSVLCLAVSKNGCWTAAGTYWGRVFVWDSETRQTIFEHQDGYKPIFALDFSPDSSRLIAGSEHGKAFIWDVNTRQQVKTLSHEGPVIAARFSPQGDQIATATEYSVRIWSSGDDNSLPVRISVKVTPSYNNGLLWLGDRLYVVSGNRIQQLDPSLGSVVSEFPVPSSDVHSCISLPERGEFIAYSTNRSLTFWDIETHSRLGFIEHDGDIRSVALSPGDRSIAVCREDGNITIQNLSHIISSFPSGRLHQTLQEPEIDITHTALDAWKSHRLDEADALLTTAIEQAHNPSHHALAARALVRARLKHWDEALVDAQRAINVQPSVIAYIAKSFAYIGQGNKDAAYRACDIAFEYFHSEHVTLLLLVKAIVAFMANEHADAISRMDDLIATVRFNSPCCTVQAYMWLLLGNMHMQSKRFQSATQAFQRAREQVRHNRIQVPLVVILMSGWQFDDLHIIARQRLCEALYATSRKKDACDSLLEMVNTFDEEVYMSEATMKWIIGFIQQCLSAPPNSGNAALTTTQGSTVSMCHATTLPLLRVWVKAQLTRHSWKAALLSAVNLVVPKCMVYQAICEHLEYTDRVTDASECLRQMMGKLGNQGNAEQAQWASDFKSRCLKKLENGGDAAMGVHLYGDAISNYSASLALGPATPQVVFVKRSKAYVAHGVWEEALCDANKAIELDRLSPWGYERKHAALHLAGDFSGAIGAFEEMFSVILQSSNPKVYALRDQYTTPETIKTSIRKTIQAAISDSPHVLINTTSGRLCGKSEQAASFESQPDFNKLISSMTTQIDYARIEHDVTEYYRYAMFSHRWEGDEPLFEEVVRTVVHKLGDVHTHRKLKKFCNVVRDAKLHWAWSDTCCINKMDRDVLQEALVSMFKWYQGSALTIIFLCDVLSPSRRGDLVKSIWNTRAWTFQEYHASKVVRFYTKDWSLYLNLDIPNHKESGEIISEMEEATGVSAQTLKDLQPGLNSIREKLCLASTRQATRVEDAAYSLLGIFSMSMSVLYGEGDKALGRLLAQLLSGSGDTSILSWTGKSGGFNSCLPAKIDVFEQQSPPHIPPTIIASLEMERVDTMHRALPSVMKLYDQLHDFSVPSFVGRRLKLPCLIFTVELISVARTTSGFLAQTTTDALGHVEIATTEDLSRLGSMILVHPWIDFLLDRRPVESSIAHLPHGSNTALPASHSRTAWPNASIDWPFGRSSSFPPPVASFHRPSTVPQEVRRTQALELAARLRQQFGALLFTPIRHNIHEYRRIATDSEITVQLQEDIPWSLLLKSTKTLDVL